MTIICAILLPGLAILSASVLAAGATRWQNPIVKLLSLILTFLFSSFILILYDFYFLGLTYLIVYIGAIAILFLFVIMINPTGGPAPRTPTGAGVVGLGG